MPQEDQNAVSATAEELCDLAAFALTLRGATDEHACIQAEHLVQAELRGHPSHGLRRLAVLATRIDNGLIDPAAEPILEWTATAALRVDGAGGFGPVAAYRAISELRSRIPESGIAAAALCNTHHLGMLAPYVENLAATGLVGIVLSSTEGLVHPWGGAGALLGTNPLGIAVPAAGGDLTLDMSTGAVSAGKILDYRAKGLPIPLGWAVDPGGRATTDATSAAGGAISPFGGAKGYALGLAFGALVGALTGTALGPDVHGTLDTTYETSKGDVIIAIDPTVFAGTDMRSAIGAYFDTIRASGVDGAPVTVPGDRARAAGARAQREHIAVSGDVWASLQQLTATASAGSVADPSRTKE